LDIFFNFSRKLERAEQLITGFGGEREKWAEMSQKLETQYVQVGLYAITNKSNTKADLFVFFFFYIQVFVIKLFFELLSDRRKVF
jgi:hypothetical protein